MVKLILRIEDQDKLAEAQALGLEVSSVGEHWMEVECDVLRDLKEGGFDYRVESEAIRVTFSTQDRSRQSEYCSNDVDTPIPDYNQSGLCPDVYNAVFLGCPISSAPAGAVVTGVEYRTWVGHTWPGDLVLAISSGVDWFEYVIWDRDGSWDDGGYDDDVEYDQDIYLNWRSIDTYFDGEPVNQWWWVDASDCASADVGVIDYMEVYVYYEVLVPDLVPTDITWSPSDPDCYDTICIQGVIYNDGNGGAPASVACLYCDGYGLLCDFNVPAIPAGGDYTTPCCNLQLIGEGDYVFTLEVDCEGDVSESNEANNTRQETLYHTCPCTPQHFSFTENTGSSYDLLVTAATIHGLGLGPGDEVGVFDGMLCVGAVCWSLPPVDLVAWGDDPQTPEKDGYECGRHMWFRIWDESRQAYRAGFPSYTLRDGNFCTGPGAELSLVGRYLMRHMGGPHGPRLKGRPNPLNPDTDISYVLPEGDPRHTSLSIYNPQGQLVRVLVDEIQGAGEYMVHWDGANRLGRRVSSGIYFCVLRSGDTQEVEKLMVVK